MPLPVKAALLVVGTHAGGWPDYDTPNSTPSRELWIVSGFISWVVRSLSFMVQTATGDAAGARSSARGLGVHRRFSHVIEGCAIAGVLVWFAVGHVPALDQWAVWFGLVAFVGSFSHVVLGDNLTPHGVPISLVYNMLTPGPNWRRHRIEIGGETPLKTDQPSEHLGFMLLVRVATVLVAAWALALPLTVYVLVAGAIAGAVWHLCAYTGLLHKALH